MRIATLTIHIGKIYNSVYDTDYVGQQLMSMHVMPYRDGEFVQRYDYL